jgi:hypothetical protein
VAAWADLVRFVDRTYKYELLSDELLKLVFNVANLRSQVVFIEHAFNDSQSEWCKVSSPIGKLDPSQIVYAAQRLGDMLLGGLTMEDDMVYVTTAIPLLNIDANEITDSIDGVVNIADKLESDILGTDEY